MLSNIINLRSKKMSLPHRKRFKTNSSFDNYRIFNFVLMFRQLLSEQKEPEENSSKPMYCICIMDLLLANTEQSSLWLSQREKATFLVFTSPLSIVQLGCRCLVSLLLISQVSLPFNDQKILVIAHYQSELSHNQFSRCANRENM